MRPLQQWIQHVYPNQGLDSIGLAQQMVNDKCEFALTTMQSTKKQLNDLDDWFKSKEPFSPLTVR